MEPNQTASPRYAYRWRDTQYCLDHLAADAFGYYVYTTQIGDLTLGYQLRAGDDGLPTIILETLNGAPLLSGLPATSEVNGHLVLAPCASLRPATVPEAILLTIAWIEWLASREGQA